MAAARAEAAPPFAGDDTQRRRAFEGRLAGYRARVQPVMRRGFPRGGPPGLYDLVASYPSRPWKGLRSALCLAMCSALGGNEDEALNSGAAIELFHNAFLVYDDIQDESRSRRGKPTLPCEHGIGIALNVGNATALLAMQRVMSNRSLLGPLRARLIADESARMMRLTLEGQALELDWIRRNAVDLGPRDYLRMCLKKTSWYSFVYPMRVGAIVAQGEQTSTKFVRYGWYVGAAFQIQDDILNLVGDFEKYGKEIGGDLREGKRTLMLTHLMGAAAPRVRRRLLAILAKPAHRRTVDEGAWIFERLAEAGSIDFARRAARQLAGAALLEGLSVLQQYPDSDSKQFILRMPLYVVDREH